MVYARRTRVPVDRTRQEIEKLITRAGAVEFGYAMRAGGAIITFRMHDRFVRFDMAFPDRKGSIDKHEQEIRRRWRALLLVLKAKFEATATGITTFETEFLAHIVLPGGRTVAQDVVPQIAAAYKSKSMSGPLMLTAGSSGE
jgi:hypothetical protein